MGPVGAKIFNSNFPLFRNAAHELPEHILHAFAVVLDCRVMVQLLADEFV